MFHSLDFENTVWFTVWFDLIWISQSERTGVKLSIFPTSNNVDTRPNNDPNILLLSPQLTTSGFEFCVILITAFDAVFSAKYDTLLFGMLGPDVRNFVRFS